MGGNTDNKPQSTCCQEAIVFLPKWSPGLIPHWILCRPYILWYWSCMSGKPYIPLLKLKSSLAQHFSWPPCGEQYSRTMCPRCSGYSNCNNGKFRSNVILVSGSHALSSKDFSIQNQRMVLKKWLFIVWHSYLFLIHDKW